MITAAARRAGVEACRARAAERAAKLAPIIAEAAGRGAVVLGRNKEACMADENQALNTLKQNWSKYVANDKTLCIGMESTGGPASYVELLSCIEVNRDASTTTGSASTVLALDRSQLGELPC
jgi:hypothetical protein